MVNMESQIELLQAIDRKNLMVGNVASSTVSFLFFFANMHI